MNPLRALRLPLPLPRSSGAWLLFGLWKSGAFALSISASKAGPYPVTFSLLSSSSVFYPGSHVRREGALAGPLPSPPPSPPLPQAPVLSLKAPVLSLKAPLVPPSRSTPHTHLAPVWIQNLSNPPSFP